MTTQVYAKTIVVSIWNNTPERRQRQTSDCDILGIKADLWSEIVPRKAKGSWKFSTYQRISETVNYPPQQLLPKANEMVIYQDGK